MKLKNLLKRFQKFKPVPAYHKHIETLPVWNWFEIKKTGDLRYLFINYEKNKVAPDLFEFVYFEMIFQFDKVDNTIFRLLAEKQYFKSLSLTEKQPIFAAKVYEIENQIQSIISNADGGDGLTLNDFIRYIETTNKCIGTLKTKEISTSYAFSLFEAAKEQNEALNAKYREK